MRICLQDQRVPELASYQHCPPNLLICEGRIPVQSLLDSDFEIASVVLNESSPTTLTLPQGATFPVYELAREHLSQMLGYSFHRGVIACAKRPQPRHLSQWIHEHAPTSGLFVFCSHISDESNLGAIIRNAAAFGAQAVVVGPKCGDPYSKKAIRTSAGTLFRLPILQSPDILEDLESMRALPADVLATTLTDEAIPLSEYRANHGATALVLGSEAHGLSEREQHVCTHQITIPMASTVDSLNVAASSAIFLHALSQGVPVSATSASPQSPRPSPESGNPSPPR